MFHRVKVFLFLTLILILSIKVTNIFLKDTTYFDEQFSVNLDYMRDGTFLLYNIENLKDPTSRRVSKDGLVVVDYSKVASSTIEGGVYFQPIAAAMVLIDRIAGSEKISNQNNKILMRNADEVIHQVLKYGVPTFSFPVTFSGRDLSPSEKSALAIAYGQYILLEAFRLTQNRLYYDHAVKLQDNFESTIENGGVQNDTSGWFEEYAFALDAPSILNGHVTVVLLQLSFCLKYDLPKSCEIWQNGERILRQKVDLYNIGIWTKYSLNKEYTISNHLNLSSPLYQKLHAKQMEMLHLATRDPYYLELRNTFHEQYHSLFGDIMRLLYVLYYHYKMGGKS